MTLTELPPVKPWSDRRKSLPRLAGGNEQQLDTLRWLLTQVTSQSHTRDSLRQAYKTSFGTTATTAQVTIQDLIGCEFLEEADGPNQHRESAFLLRPSSVAWRWLDTDDRALAIGLLHANVRFVGELLYELRSSPLTRDDLLHRAVSGFGMNWTTKGQVGDRLCWLRSAGYVVAPGRSLRAITRPGIEFLEQINIFVP